MKTYKNITDNYLHIDNNLIAPGQQFEALADSVVSIEKLIEVIEEQKVQPEVTKKSRKVATAAAE